MHFGYTTNSPEEARRSVRSLFKLLKPVFRHRCILKNRCRSGKTSCCVAELHGGSVEVESKRGEGSRFTVFLPWNPSSDAMPSPGEQQLHTEKQKQPIEGITTGVKVLLAEDDKAILALLIDSLQTQGYTLISAQNGEEAVSIALQQRPDVILMDIQMPGMDGLQAIERLRQNKGFHKIPIIALTALAMPGDRERCLEAGADDYLAKPVGLKELHQRIQSWVQRFKPKKLSG